MRVVQTLLAAQVITRNDGGNDRDARGTTTRTPSRDSGSNGPVPPPLPKR